MNANLRPLAVVTGASTGIGLELARLCAKSNYDLIVAADESLIDAAAQELSGTGVECTPIQCDLSTEDGVKSLTQAIEQMGRPVDFLLANAGQGLYLFGAHYTANANTIQGNGSDGIFLDQVTQSTMSANTVYGNAGNGISLSHGGNNTLSLTFGYIAARALAQTSE